MLFNRNDVISNKEILAEEKIAPGEGRLTDHFLQDPFNEELTFLKIYGGEKIPYFRDKNITYGQICRSEIRRYDRRCAECLPKLFYMYKKLVAKRLLQSIEMSLKKTKNTENLTARDAKDSAKMKEFISNAEAELMLRANRSSPQFWEWKKMEINAMIRQLGCPTFFMTFSPAEQDWIDLLLQVSRAVNYPGIERDEAINLNKKQRLQLLGRDPVTVARYFENRMIALFKLIFNRNTVFAENPNIDLFWRVDFQYCGSPHIHLLAWMQGAPKYDNDNLENLSKNMDECHAFIDKYITCKRPVGDVIVSENRENNVNLKYQFHRHMKMNCILKNDDNDHVLCKYGFPWPIMDSTIILEPLKTGTSNKRKIILAEYYQILRGELTTVAKEYEKDNQQEKQTISLTDFLEQLSIVIDKEVDQDLYLEILRSSIKRSTVFLRRNCRELMLNPYNKFIISMHRANMDIQYVTDPYGAAAYVSAYMLKSNAVMSVTLKKAQREIALGNFSIRNRLLKLANVFHNSSEVGAQECFYKLLSMPVAKSSRKIEFINTFKEEKRNHMVKDRRYLDLMNEEDTDIFKKGLLNHYKNRPLDLRDVCLAEYASHYDYISNTEKKAIGKSTKPLSLFPEDIYEEDEDEYIRDLSDTDEPETASNIKVQQNKDGAIRKRTKPKILRYKRYNKIRDIENWTRVQTMLYYPWQDDIVELEDADRCNRTYEEYKDTVIILLRKTL